MSIWDDEPAPWGDDEGAPGGGEGAEGGEGGAAGGEAAPAEPVKVVLLKLEPPHYNHHWVKPLYLNYAYLLDYRKFYYNDVIDYLNCRNKGLFREVPRAQEWAERAIRMYDHRNTDKSHKTSSDMKYITGMRLTPRHYSYHTRAYYSLKYQKIL